MKTISKNTRNNNHFNATTTLWFLLVSAAIATCLVAPAAAFGQDEAQAQPRVSPRTGFFGTQRVDVERRNSELARPGSPPAATTLPVWRYTTQSSRDGNTYTGFMVGASPFTSSGNKNIAVPAYVIPLVIMTNSIATFLNFSTGVFSTSPGETTFDPTAPNACLVAPNNIPSQLFAESPILKPAKFNFGTTDVGTAQYNDAFQRGNFWQALGDNGITDAYHVKLGPVTFLDPIVINVPAANGIAALSPYLFGITSVCPPVGIIDINWFDAYLTGTILPSLAPQGVRPSTLAIFMLSNVLMATEVTNYSTCCDQGYHSAKGIPYQTYVVGNFDSSRFWFSTSLHDSGVFSHEVGEWMNDPFIANVVPAWGHVGQQSGCQNSLEVGDPLTFTPFPPVNMPNGFTYHLQELAFYSWFFGAPSIGVNGWFSDNDTFKTDAGPPCQN
jgi:hypothetical protein